MDKVQKHPIYALKYSASEAERSGGDRREPERSSTSEAAAPPPEPQTFAPPDPEVPGDRPKRRRFTAEYKKVSYLGRGGDVDSCKWLRA